LVSQKKRRLVKIEYFKEKQFVALIFDFKAARDNSCARDTNNYVKPTIRKSLTEKVKAY